jgi:hypothetical protein
MIKREEELSEEKPFVGHFKLGTDILKVYITIQIRSNNASHSTGKFNLTFGSGVSLTECSFIGLHENRLAVQLFCKLFGLHEVLVLCKIKLIGKW